MIQFRPNFLHELVQDLYEGQPNNIIEHEIKQLLEDVHGKGNFWEKVLAKHMHEHTSILKRNAWYRDFTDNSDAKFCTVVRYTSGVFQATIGGVGNKIGPLRVCMCQPGDRLHKLYFMLIPYEYYSKLSGHPIKITFQNFKPIGEIWDRFQCSFAEVTKSLSEKPKVVYTDEYQLLLEVPQ